MTDAVGTIHTRAQRDRRTIIWKALLTIGRLHDNTPPHVIPRPEDLSMYRRRKDGAWLRTKYRRADSPRDSVRDPKIEFASDFLVSSAWSMISSEARKDALMVSRNAVYVLAMRDYGTKKWLSYVGKADSSVVLRWFFPDSTSHLGQVLLALRTAKNGIEKRPKVSLVDMLLAYHWATHGTWKDLAMLFVISDRHKETALYEEKRIRTQYDLTNPMFGFNMVS